MAREKKTPHANKACYYVTFNVTDWIDLFVRPSYKQAIVDALNDFIDHRGLIVHAWCLMSNHLHLLARTRDERSFLTTTRALKKDMTKKIFAMLASEPDMRKEWILQQFEAAGKSMKRLEKYQLWQNCSNPVFIDFSNKTQLWNHIRYIHENPVRDRVVDRETDYLFSSARSYYGLKGLVRITVIPMAGQSETTYQELTAMIHNAEIKN